MENVQTKLSVNINKVALIRNSRGGNRPDVVQVAKDCEMYGADGITVHPRPDERHIRFSDLQPLKAVNTTEFNIEGYPSDHFLNAVLAVKPDQCTLVPDPPGALTSDSGWDTIGKQSELAAIIKKLNDAGVRVSVFIDPKPEFIKGAKDAGANRVELYTGKYAAQYLVDPVQAIAAHRVCAEEADRIGIGLNAGHDLDLVNLSWYRKNIPNLLEVSIGHALISDALYFGLSNVIAMYRRKLTYVSD